MHIKRARQILKAFSDDSRMRIINLLNKEELSVTELRRVLNRNQSIVSKHLTRLRLTGIVGDRRKGMNVYYYLAQPKDRSFVKLVHSVISGFSDIEIFREDLKRLKQFRKKIGIRTRGGL